VNEPGTPFRLGINYWPAATGMQWWSRFDATAVAYDFERIAAAGMDSVRLFLLWEAFQPSPREIDDARVALLVEVCDTAAHTGLQLIVTLFTGHMSAANWLPAWALGAALDPVPRFPAVSSGRPTGRILRNWYTDPEIPGAQAWFCGEIAARLSGHPAIWAWDLGNENSNCCMPPDRASGRAWLERTTSALRRGDPGRPVTLGMHMEDLEFDRNLHPVDAATYCDFLCMHGYPAYAPWVRAPDDEQLLPFLALVTRWLGGGVPVLFEEFGAPTVPDGTSLTEAPYYLEESAAAAYYERALAAIHGAGAIGAMGWCYADYAPAIWGEEPFEHAPHERFFGLWRPDGSPKPAAATFAAIAGASVEPPPPTPWIDLAPHAFYDAPAEHLHHLYSRYVAATAS